MDSSEYYYENINSTSSSYETTLDYDYDDDEMCSKTSIIKFGQIFTPVFFSIVVVLSLLGNILVLVTLIKYENLRSLTNTFILNLALSDLLFTTGLPFWAHYHMYGWTLGESACKVVNSIFYLGFYSSGILLILMTAHRYVAVMNPLSDNVTTTGFYSVITSVVIWVVSIIIASPAFIGTEVKESNQCVFQDSNWNLWAIYMQNILFLLSSVVFIFCYSQIMCRLMRPTAQRRRHKTLKLIFIFILMIVFFLKWVPYNIVIFLQSLYYFPQYVQRYGIRENCEAHKRLDYAFAFSRLLAFSHGWLNPVFYVFMGIKFKNHLKKMPKSLGRNNRSNCSSNNNPPNQFTVISVTSGEEISM